MKIPSEDKSIHGELKNGFDMKESESDKKCPYISVIITAHDRKEFIKEAIYSVINQTLSRSLYEIIVIKNFDDQEIDNLIEKETIINLKVRDNSLIGEDLSLGIEKAKGEIISFLDDDDLFMAEKLETVYNSFKKYENLVYFHNNEYFIDDKDIPTKFWVKNVNEDVILNYVSNLNEIFELRDHGIFFNMSSISLRKNKIMGYLEHLKKINTNPDDFMFFISTSDQHNLFKLSKEKLTKYRLHQSTSINLSKDINKFLNHNMKILKDFVSAKTIIMDSLDENTIYKSFVKYSLISNKINLYLIANNYDIKFNELLFNFVTSFKIKGSKPKIEGLYYLTLFIFSKISYERVREFYGRRNFKYIQEKMSNYL